MSGINTNNPHPYRLDQTPDERLPYRAFEEGRRAMAMDIGESLCNLIGSTMLEDKDKGKLLGEQLTPLIKCIQKYAGMEFKKGN